MFHLSRHETAVPDARAFGTPLAELQAMSTNKRAHEQAEPMDSALVEPYQLLPFGHPFVREERIAADRESTSYLALAAVWMSLASGDLAIKDEFCDEERCYLVLAPRSGGLSEPTRHESIEVFRRILVQGSEKVVSLDMALSAATIACRGKRATTWMGLSCRVLNAPLLVAAAAWAFTERSSANARCVQRGHGPERELCVSLARPETRLQGQLSPASLQVLKSFVAGKDRSRIALERGTSQRTVANQLSVAFGALRVSGRLDVLRKLAKEAVATAEMGA